MNMSNYQTFYTRRTNDGAVSLAVLFFFNVLPRYTNFFEECVVRCAHLSIQEKECTSFSWEDSKMYIPGNIANSQKMLTEINESDAITKIK